MLGPQQLGPPPQFRRNLSREEVHTSDGEASAHTGLVLLQRRVPPLHIES
jgi:hypothetical protein